MASPRQRQSVLRRTPAAALYQEITVGRALVLLQRLTPKDDDERMAIRDAVRRLRELLKDLRGESDL